MGRGWRLFLMGKDAFQECFFAWCAALDFSYALRPAKEVEASFVVKDRVRGEGKWFLIML